MRKLSTVDTVHLDVETALKDTAVKVDVPKFCANTRTKIQGRIHRQYMQLQKVSEDLRNDVGDLPA